MYIYILIIDSKSWTGEVGLRLPGCRAVGLAGPAGPAGRGGARRWCRAPAGPATRNRRGHGRRGRGRCLGSRQARRHRTALCPAQEAWEPAVGSRRPAHCRLS